MIEYVFGTLLPESKDIFLKSPVDWIIAIGGFLGGVLISILLYNLNKIESKKNDMNIIIYKDKISLNYKI